MKNQILEKRIAQLVAQTFCLPLNEVLVDVQTIGVDRTIEAIENKQEVKF